MADQHFCAAVPIGKAKTSNKSGNKSKKTKRKTNPGSKSPEILDVVTSANATTVVIVTVATATAAIVTAATVTAAAVIVVTVTVVTVIAAAVTAVTAETDRRLTAINDELAREAFQA